MGSPTLFSLLALRLAVPCMLPPSPEIRYDVGAVDDSPVFHEPEGIHQKGGQTFPANPDQGNHSCREGCHAQDDDACGQR